MDFDSVMEELEKLGKEQTKKTYINHGAHEPLFGVTTGSMKPLLKKTGKNQELANQLYDTGNYDAMYFAGMIAEPNAMTKENFNQWMKNAYFYMISDYVVAVTLAETSFAQEVADEWIHSGKEFYMSAGWSCYDWLIGSSSDSEFDAEKMQAMLKEVENTIHNQPNRARYAMNNFVISTAISYLPLHDEAIKVAEKIGKIDVYMGKTACKTPLATEYIQNAIDKGRLGFKRKNVRC